MNPAVVSLRVLAVEEVQNLSKAEALSGHVEVYEIALRAATRNCTHFHARNIAQIGDSNFKESDLGKEYRIGVSEEAHLGFSNCGVERVRSLCNQREFRQCMNALEESLLIELDGSKKIQIQGKPVAELEGEPRSAGKVEAVNDMRIPKGSESYFS
jgi:hypothetical protein